MESKEHVALGFRGLLINYLCKEVYLFFFLGGRDSIGQLHSIISFSSKLWALNLLDDHGSSYKLWALNLLNDHGENRSRIREQYRDSHCYERLSLPYASLSLHNFFLT